MTVAGFYCRLGLSLGRRYGGSRPDYNDADWRKLNLPHDWAIEGEFSKDNPSGTGGGALPGGIGWYRKTFTADKPMRQTLSHRFRWCLYELHRLY